MESEKSANIYNSKRVDMVSSAKYDVMRNNNSENGEPFFVGFVQMFSSKTAPITKSFALVVYLVHAWLLKFSTRFSQWLLLIGLTLVWLHPLNCSISKIEAEHEEHGSDGLSANRVLSSTWVPLSDSAGLTRRCTPREENNVIPARKHDSIAEPFTIISKIHSSGLINETVKVFLALVSDCCGISDAEYIFAAFHGPVVCLPCSRRLSAITNIGHLQCHDSRDMVLTKWVRINRRGKIEVAKKLSDKKIEVSTNSSWSAKGECRKMFWSFLGWLFWNNVNFLHAMTTCICYLLLNLCRFCIFDFQSW